MSIPQCTYDERITVTAWALFSRHHNLDLWDEAEVFPDRPHGQRHCEWRIDLAIFRSMNYGF